MIARPDVAAVSPGMPVAVAFLVALAEAGGAVLVFVGGFLKDWMTRLGALAIIPVMLGAILMVHWGQWHFMASETHPMGGMQFQTTLLLILVYLLIKGNGVNEAGAEVAETRRSTDRNACTRAPGRLVMGARWITVLPSHSLRAMITLHLKEQGETLIFFSEPDPAAPILEFECSIAPGKSGPEPHKHPLQTETFRVIRGQMLAKVDGEERFVREDETIVVAPGRVHTFRNPDPTEPLTMQITIEPALNFQWFLTEAARSAIRHGGSWKDMPLLETSYIISQVSGEHDWPGMPPVVKRLLFGTLARLAVLLKKTGEITPLGERKVAV